MRTSAVSKATPLRPSSLPFAVVETLIGFWLIGCVAVFCIETLHWPLVNDAALIHYISFLMNHGLKPYRDILDPNMPGTYCIDWLVIHVFGGDAIGARLYDLLLLSLAAIAMFVIAWRKSKFAALNAACLFILFHGRDGMMQTGQRDLAIAVLLLAAIALATQLSSRSQLSTALCLGLVIGIATTIKPFALLSLSLIIPVLSSLPSNRRAKILFAVAVGLLIPLLAVAIFLVHLDVVRPFLFVLLILDPFHARLGFPGVRFLISHCFTLPLIVMSLLGVAAMRMTSSTQRNVERELLLVGTVVGTIGYFAQLKGFPYHRYPSAACLLLLVSIEFIHAVKRKGPSFWIGAVGLAYGTILAPLYLERALHRTWPNEMELALIHDLKTFGGPDLNGNIQCIDSVSGCTRVLYDQRLLQSTGVMYDEFFFVPHPPPSLVSRRDQFLRRLEETEPKLIVVTPDSFPQRKQADAKLLLWPAFDTFLSRCYDEISDRAFRQGDSGEDGYRLYRARAKCHTKPI
jgi:hypothetical protein